jgi:selenocysteine lyase/cysteine desulfurase
MDVEKLVKKADYPASQQCVYLNAASVALMHTDAAKVAIDWQKDVAENGTINFDEKAEENIFDDLHRAVARLFNADDEDIAVGSSATELTSSLAWAVLPDRTANIVGTDAAHPSTVYPWQRVARHVGCEVRLAKANKNGIVSNDELISLIDNHTAIVNVSHVEYRSGQMYNLEALAHEAHAHDALIVVDATQSAGQVPINARDWEVDVLVSSGYKWLCGPFGAAVMYIAPTLQARLDPGLVGWRSHRDMWNFRADRLEFPGTAKRFEASTMAYGLAPSLACAVEFLNKIGVVRIFKHNKALVNWLRNGFEQRNGVIASPPRDSERSSIISVRFPGHDASAVAGYLNAAKVVVSARGDFIRFSPHLYNDEEDIQHVFEVMDKVL